MTPEFESLLAELPKIEKRMVTWAVRFSEYFDQKPLFGRVDFAKQEKVARERAGISEINEIYAYLDRLSLAYLQADPAQREQARLAMAEQRGLVRHLGRYVRAVSERIKTKADLDLLRIGLAALSLEDYTYDPGLDAKASYDARKLYDSLKQLYQAASRAGIEAESEIQAVAALSSENPSRAAPDSPSVKSHMGRFTQTDYFINVLKKQK